MFRWFRGLLVGALLVTTLGVAAAANAEDEIPIAAEVLGTEGAPVLKVSFNSPVGKKADAALLPVFISGLEPSKPALFKVTPLPDAIARFTSSSSGTLSAKVELPYGLVPGQHELMVETVFGLDEIPASYTVGQFYVDDAGMLTNSDGTYPKGTRPAVFLTPNSAEAFQTKPNFRAPAGGLRVSEPQLRVDQSLLPRLALGLTFDNSMTSSASFRAKVTLFTFFGQQVGKPFYADFDSMAGGESRSVILRFGELPPVGFFRVHTQVILPDDFSSETPVITSIDSDFFVFPVNFAVLMALVLAVALLVRQVFAAKKITGALK